ncbi:uncharacterized protein LOC143022726 [Oratosquilla oratoria]|uniref:uncharacterized protein LOC143022726 n=1 Tax=Oratosquilla oratoria TaxID=337810 RepID=UPI003F762ADA
MRPITSGIGSAPHRLAKRLAKPLSNALGSISQAHLKNSTDLINRLNNVDFKGKEMASFDVKALFTSVPKEGAMEAVKEAVDKISENELPVSKSDYIKLISLCVSFDPFTFSGNVYRQHQGLAMGSPLSAGINIKTKTQSKRNNETKKRQETKYGQRHKKISSTS